MIELVPLDYYYRVFYWPMFIICCLTAFYYLSSTNCEKLLRQYSILLPIILAIILIVFIGLRPPSSKHFTDMYMYRHRWNILDTQYFVDYFSFKSEWFFDLVLLISKKLVADVQFWFFIIELFYIGCQFWACKKLLWENVWMAIMFVFFSYQFFSFGTNGIRNGMGCALMMLSIAFFCDRKTIGYIIGSMLFILAMGCHRSVIIPMAALMGSMFLIKDIKYAIYIWIACIVMSLLAGNFFVGFVANLGFDNRMAQYSAAGEDAMSQFSHTGFRWDFLLYSAMPLLLAAYVRFRKITDKTFTLIANTYILANAFWVLICRVAFSNRFAYLSWFIYSLVIAYAVIRVPIWRDQDRKAGQILLAHTAFTIIMFVIGK